MFVGVWARPLFTFLYSFPAQFGYPAAKLFTVFVCLLTGYQTFRVAEMLKLERPALVAPLLFFQPTFFQLFSDTLTEPLFALTLVIAFRLHLAGHLATGALLASLLILIRPEGFFIGILWGLWLLAERSASLTLLRRMATAALLATGMFVWWLVALLITGDPRFIPNNWPPDWDATAATYGSGALWTYVLQLPEIAGPLLWIFLLLGLGYSIRIYPRNRVAQVFLTVFVVHSILRSVGLFGSAGYARYFVCVAPMTALLGLIGWNRIAEFAKGLPRLRIAAASVVLVLSAAFSVFYVDAAVYTRDARAVAEMFSWFRANERPVSRLIWSQAYMCILFDRDPWERPTLTADKASTIEALRQSPAGTLVFWDGDTGPAWYGITDKDLQEIGYVRLQSRDYQLSGLLRQRWWYHDWGPRKQAMHLFYKQPDAKA
jgi:hypothetical protein